MNEPTNPLFKTALSLPESERAGLALQLLQSLTPPGKEIPNEQFGQQLRERVQKHRSGEIGSLSLEEARAEIKKKLSSKANH